MLQNIIKEPKKYLVVLVCRQRDLVTVAILEGGGRIGNLRDPFREQGHTDYL